MSFTQAKCWMDVGELVRKNIKIHAHAYSILLLHINEVNYFLFCSIIYGHNWYGTVTVPLFVTFSFLNL